MRSMKDRWVKYSAVTALTLSLVLLVACSSSAPPAAAPTKAPEAKPAAAAPTQAPAAPAAASTAAPAAKKFSLKLGTIRTDADPTTLGAKKFAELVKQKSGGSIEVQVFANSQLGGLLDMEAGMQSGTVDMVYEGVGTYGWIKGAEWAQIQGVPFFWDSYDQFIKIWASPEIQKQFDDTAKKVGVRIIGVRGDTETRELTSNKLVKDAAGFEGLKVRIAESKVVEAAMKALGANPVVIPFADLYLSLKQGIADAQENGPVSVKNNSLFEVQKYFIRTRYIRDSKAWYVSEKQWQAMSPDQQKAMLEASTEAADYETQQFRAQEDEAVKFLATKMEVIEPDIPSIRAKLTGAFDSFDGPFWTKGTLEQFTKLKSQIK